MNEGGEMAEVGELPEVDEVVVSTLPALRVSCNSWVEVLLHLWCCNGTREGEGRRACG